MSLPVNAVLLKHVQMVGAPRGTENKIVPARNTIFPTILVAERHEERRERVSIFEGLNGNSDIEDRFGENPRNGCAPDMLNVDRGRSKHGRKPIPLGRKAQRPFRTNDDQTQLAGIQTEIWNVGFVLHKSCEAAWHGPDA